jgi:MIP family channel proteins
VKNKEFLGEFFGTFILILFGNGVVATVTLFGLGGFEMITWGWGLGVVFGIYVSSKTSGAHLNPAITIALAVRKGFPWNKVPIYILAQFLGAFFAAIVVYLNYYDAIASWEIKNIIPRGVNDSVRSAGIFATYPPDSISNMNAFFDQFLGTALLVILVLAITDVKNKVIEVGLAPFAVGLAVVAIGMSFGGNAGYAINPARDFGPRLATYFLGWGEFVFRAHNYYFWIPIVGPILGGTIGAIIYDYFLGNYLEE